MDSMTAHSAHLAFTRAWLSLVDPAKIGAAGISGGRSTTGVPIAARTVAAKNTHLVAGFPDFSARAVHDSIHRHGGGAHL